MFHSNVGLRSIRLYPVTIIVSFLVMGAPTGIAGALLAVPAAVVVTTIVDQPSVKDPPEGTVGR